MRLAAYDSHFPRWASAARIRPLGNCETATGAPASLGGTPLVIRPSPEIGDSTCLRSSPNWGDEAGPAFNDGWFPHSPQMTAFRSGQRFGRSSWAHRNRP